MVQLELAPDVEERLEKAAAVRGLKPEAYVVELIEAAVTRSLPEKHLTEEQLQAFLDGMAAFSDKLPVLPDYAYTRESFYEDHD
jgi:hypothetical protein